MTPNSVPNNVIF